MTEKAATMDHEEWIRFVWLNRASLIQQLQKLFPDVEFTNIDPGLYPIIYLKRLHGQVELDFQAVKIELDDEDDIREATLLPQR